MAEVWEVAAAVQVPESAAEAREYATAAAVAAEAVVAE